MGDPTDSVTPANRREWRAWLRVNHRRRKGVWLIFAKKASGVASITYEDALQEALCFGWIDAKVQTIDETYYRQTFTPRTARSPWSAPNKARAERLIASGAMTKAGLAAIDAAKKDGRWAASDAEANRPVARDFASALKAAGARKNFDAFSASAKRTIIGWIEDAKRPDTRSKRIDTAARMAAKNLRARIDTDA